MSDAALQPRAAPVPAPAESWGSGDGYEPYVGRWSRLVAREFLEWLQLPSGLSWVDVGCGTGALSSAVSALAAPAAVCSLDRSSPYAAFARTRLGGGPGRHVLVGDAAALPLASQCADALVSALVLNFLSDPPAALREWRRVARPGSTVALYVWDYAEGMQLMRHFWEAAVALDPAAAVLDEGARFPLCQPGALRRALEEAGYRHVQVTGLEVETVFRGFDDYWSPFLGGQGPAPGYLLALTEDERVRLRERVREGLPVGPDGAIPLRARAWAVRGRA